MPSNSLGKLFRITTWGESHGKAIGVVIDGCPAGVDINENIINCELAKRAPGKNAFTTPRKEKDHAQILSGVFEGKTTGAPISILIPNADADSSKYTAIKDLLRPGHANYTYLEKYGCFDYRGGGRASARETACRVAAGAIAKEILRHEGVKLLAFLSQVGQVKADTKTISMDKAQKGTSTSPIFCPDACAEEQMIQAIEKAKEEGDSLGGIVSFLAEGVPVGLGDPIYEKLEANLAKAMMSLPASKGFEIGEGFSAVTMKGSEHNDSFSLEKGKVATKTNHSGGLLGGISNGMPIIGRVAFKPTSSIKHQQSTLNTANEEASFLLPEGSRHDPCVAIRAVPVVEAMLALVLVDALLLNRSSKIGLKND
jgi:chorismate synthase